MDLGPLTGSPRMGRGDRVCWRPLMDDRAHDLLSAALRHVRDAEHLAAAGVATTSLDQAYHLAGFAPECARKATLPRSTYDQAIGHGVGESSEIALQVALAIDPRAQRYDLERWRNRFPGLADWNERARYDRTGTRLHPEVTNVIRESREIVDRIVLSLWMDGAIRQDFSW